MQGCPLLHLALVSLGRDIELGGEEPSLEVLVLAPIPLERASYPIAVCVEGIIAILVSVELSADGNELGGQIQSTAETLEGKGGGLCNCSLVPFDTLQYFSWDSGSASRDEHIARIPTGLIAPI